MHSICLIVFVAQLPFAAASADEYAALSRRATGSAATLPSDAIASANEEKLRQLFATTKSVMKRRGDSAEAGQPGGDGAAFRDADVLQAAFNLQATGSGQAGAGTASGAASANGASDAATPPPSADGAARSDSAIGDTIRAAAEASAALLASALAAPSENALTGRPVSLAEALSRVSNSPGRLEVASLYWKVALATADYHWAVDEALQLGSLVSAQGVVDSPLLAAAQAAAQASKLEAKAVVVAAQQELADAIGQPTQALPLTVEQPLVGPYRTEFDTIFANRAAPGRSRAIHRALPHRREAIDFRTAAVQAAGSAVAPADEAYGKGTGGIEAVLTSHRELAQQRRAFLNAVREYNADIVEYASYVAGPSTSTATLVSMLTRSKPNKMSSGDAPGTFAEPNQPTLAPHDPNVRPATALEPAPDDQWKAGGQGPAIRSPADVDPAVKPQ